MANARLYGFWDGLTEALQTGQPQNEIKHTGKSMFEGLYADPARLEQFMRAMSGISAGNFHALAEKFDFSPYSSVCDVGGATGQLSIILAEAPPAPDVHESSTCRRWNPSRGARSRLPALPIASRQRRVTSSAAHFRRPTSSRWA